MRPTIIVIFLLINLVSFGQSTTYINNYGTNYINGKSGEFKKSSFTWTIVQNGNSYNISTNANNESFNVTYLRFDNNDKLYVYKVIGSGIFDGSRVVKVMTTGKLSDYSNGTISQLNILAILFADDTGFIFKLNK